MSCLHCNFPFLFRFLKRQTLKKRVKKTIHKCFMPKNCETGHFSVVQQQKINHACQNRKEDQYHLQNCNVNFRLYFVVHA